MKTVRRSIRVAASPEAVFEHLADPSRYPDFFVGLHGWDPVEGDGTKPGDRLRILLEVGSTHAGGIVRIDEVDFPRVFAWESERGTRHRAWFELSPGGTGGDGTQVELAIAFRLAGNGTGRVVEQLAAPIVSRIIEATLEGLRHRVEWGHLADPGQDPT